MLRLMLRRTFTRPANHAVARRGAETELPEEIRIAVRARVIDVCTLRV